MTRLSIFLFLICLLGVAGLGIGCDARQTQKAARSQELFVRNYVKQILNQGDIDNLHHYLSDDFKNPLGPTGLPDGPAGYRVLLDIFRTAFPDMQVSIDAVVTDGKTVSYRLTSQGTHTGPFMTAAPTQRRVQWTSFVMDTFKDGKIQARYEQADMLAIMVQVGMIPLNGSDKTDP